MDPSAEGVDKKEAEKLAKNFKVLEGSFDDLNDSAAENPVCLAQEKAKALNVKLRDVVRVRFTDINGQTQAARLTVVCIMKPSNVFMSVPVFLHIKTARRLWDTIQMMYLNCICLYKIQGRMPNGLRIHSMPV
jgi:ABC-type lipoprotein release transport system permease subunit